MERTEQLDQLAAALVKFQLEVPIIPLNKEVRVTTRTGSGYSFKYATLPNIHELVKPILSKCGLAFSQLVEEGGLVTTILMHESGQFISGTFGITPVENSPQAWGSVITYNKRYSLSAILGISSEEDDDANSASGNEVKVKAEDNRPWLTEIQLQTLLTRLHNGEVELIDKAIETYRMKKEYRSQILAFKQ